MTGAGKRVGRVIALALGRAGMQVGVHFHTSAAEADATCALVIEAGGAAIPLHADLATRDGARQLVDDAIGKLGGLDLLVPSAAAFEMASLEEVTDAAWDRMLALNLTSPFTLAQRAAPHLRATRGAIVFITCSSATVPFRRHLPYVVSKGALRHLVRALSLELAPDVRVNAVAPGTVLPPDDMAAQALERIRGRIPLGRFGTPEDVADAVVYLAGAPFVTGHEIHVDGGRTVAGFERFG